MYLTQPHYPDTYLTSRCSILLVTGYNKHTFDQTERLEVLSADVITPVAGLYKVIITREIDSNPTAA